MMDIHVRSRVLTLVALRVRPGVDFDVLRQSHCPLINKELIRFQQ